MLYKFSISFNFGGFFSSMLGYSSKHFLQKAFLLPLYPDRASLNLTPYFCCIDQQVSSKSPVSSLFSFFNFSRDLVCWSIIFAQFSASLRCTEINSCASFVSLPRVNIPGIVSLKWSLINLLL